MKHLELFFWCAVFFAGVVLCAGADFLAGVIVR
jgi:hypothetical protein